MLSWLLPIGYYVVAVGALGITGKLALRTLDWPDLILWTGLGYISVAGVLLASGQTRRRVEHDSWWAMASGALAISSLIALYLALNAGKAGTVTAISAAYPVVTLILAAAFLAESVSLARAGGALLVVIGVMVLTLAD